MEKKMTKKEWFAVLANIVEASEMENKAEALVFINHEVELLEKKSAKSGATKTQKENVGIMASIKAALGEVGKAVTISALLKKLVESGEVVKTTEKKKSYFSLAE